MTKSAALSEGWRSVWRKSWSWCTASCRGIVSSIAATRTFQSARTGKSVSPSGPFVACSTCFANEGLRLDAARLGEPDSSVCPRCQSIEGRKLTAERLITLAEHFFVWGSVRRFAYGSAPAVQFNDLRKTDLQMPHSVRADAALLEDILGIGFFFYEPRFWLFGQIEPLKQLRRGESRAGVIDRVLDEYPVETLSTDDHFYRIRKNPSDPSSLSEYDSAPNKPHAGRLDSPDSPVLYSSPDLQTCLHECRVAAEDDLFVATLKPTHDLRLLNLAVVLEEGLQIDEFQSLDLAVNMLFLAGEHAYPIARSISKAVRRAGFHGLIYPSYFSMLRNGVKPIETTYGISHRKIAQYRAFEAAKMSQNLAIFGRPIAEGRIEVSCINRVVLSSVSYSVHFGPVFDSNQIRTSVFERS